MPKAKTAKKPRAKNPLTRGRPKKVASEDIQNEQPVSSAESNVFESSPPSTPPRSTKPLAEKKNVEKFPDKREPWEDLPDLRASIGTFTYITNSARHREFELAGRTELLKLHADIELMKDNVESITKIIPSVCPEAKIGRVADAIKSLDCPRTFKELVLKLVSLPPPSGYIPPLRPHINIQEPLFEVSEEEEESNQFLPHQARTFPSPSKMAKYTTPKQANGRVFQFGTSGRNGGLSTNSKAPRLAKPGEVTYSEGGSPILLRRVPDDNNLSKPHERLDYFDGDGKKIEIDLVYRGKVDASKLREFKEFARDVRGVAATRSTVKQNRIQPPRVIATAVSASTVTNSASKKKPEWR